MTNLTDEGLRQQSIDLIREICELTREDAFVIPYDERIAMIASALQQVRDAAKKEEMERCAEIAKRFNYWNNLTGKDAQELTAFRIAAYIREQE